MAYISFLNNSVGQFLATLVEAQLGSQSIHDFTVRKGTRVIVSLPKRIKHIVLDYDELKHLGIDHEFAGVARSGVWFRGYDENIEQFERASEWSSVGKATRTFYLRLPEGLANRVDRAVEHYKQPYTTVFKWLVEQGLSKSGKSTKEKESND
mgnify:CR=1